ncbi:MAG: GNAT family N-acetyltransferase [Nitrososphaerales archaeon]
MTVDDVPVVYHLGEKLYSVQKLPFLYRTWDPYEVAYLFSSETDLCFVAESDGKVAGYCLATTIEKPHKPWRYGYLIWLGVPEDLQKGGIGKKLIAELVKRMREKGIKFILVDTEEKNVAASRFFHKLGFETRHRQTWLWKNLGKSKPTNKTLRDSISYLPMHKQKRL